MQTELIMVEASRPIVHFPLGKGLVCPICESAEVRGTVDHITGLAMTDEHGQYVGETDVDWDSQRTVTSVNGDPLVQCGGYHWYFADGVDFNGEGLGTAQEEA